MADRLLTFALALSPPEVGPPVVGTIVSVTIDPDDTTVLHWEFSPECVLSAADTSPLTTDNGDGPVIPIAFLGIDGQTLLLQYERSCTVNDAWECDTQPAAVDVPGGSLEVPESGTLP